MTTYQPHVQLINPNGQPGIKVAIRPEPIEPKPNDMPNWAFALVLSLCTLAVVVLVPMMLNGGR